MAAVRLRVEGLGKRFGATAALAGVELEFRGGEVHAVVGENGAGKSTLLGLIAGLLVPDAGRLQVDGSDLRPGDPAAARRAGVGLVHQHFTVVPNFTVAENLALAFRPTTRGVLNVGAASAAGLAAAARLGWRLPAETRTGGLSVGVQQRIEIAKCLAEGPEIVLFDEPTAPLAPAEVDDLLRVLRELAAGGRAVVLVAHKLAEVLRVADRVSVLRRGRVVAAGLPREGLEAGALAKLMLGEDQPAAAAPPRGPATAGLTVRGLNVRDDRGSEAVSGVSFAVGRGEIFGVGGVDGNGQLELAEALAGARPHAGEVEFAGTATPRAGYIPADRRRDGLALAASVGENLMLGRTGRWPSPAEARRWQRRLIADYEIQPSDPDLPAGALSGGNQQKAVVARALDSEPELLVAVNPTRGLDVRAAAFVHSRLREAAARGCAVVLFSADSDELEELATRIEYLGRGRLYSSQAAAIGARASGAGS